MQEIGLFRTIKRVSIFVKHWNVHCARQQFMGTLKIHTKKFRSSFKQKDQKKRVHSNEL